MNPKSLFDPFRTLNIPRNASAKDIKSAYFKLAKLYHPDTSTASPQKFMEITRAYEMLSRKNAHTQPTEHASDSSHTSHSSRQNPYRYKDMNDPSFYKGIFSNKPLYMSNGRMAGIILTASMIGGFFISMIYANQRAKFEENILDLDYNRDFDSLDKSKYSSIDSIESKKSK